MVTIKKKKKKGKSKKKKQLDGRVYKRMQSKSLESKGYSESIVSGRLHQNSDLEVRKCNKTCKRGPAWSCDPLLSKRHPNFQYLMHQEVLNYPFI